MPTVGIRGFATPARTGCAFIETVGFPAESDWGEIQSVRPRRTVNTGGSGNPAITGGGRRLDPKLCGPGSHRVCP